jgi:hypothetical protein
MLEKQMIFPIDVNQAIGIVHPSLGGRKMVVKAVVFTSAWRKFNFLFATGKEGSN